MRLVVVLFLAATRAMAQPIATDRPDFTESTEVIASRRLQAEAGVTIHSDAPAGVFSGPELLLRVGILDRLELRVEAPNYVDDVAGPRGFGDAAAGVKLRLGPLADWGLAAIGMVSVPIGDSAVSSGRFDPSLVVTASRDLAIGASMGVQAGLSGRGGDPADVTATLVAGTDLGPRVGTFVELAATDVAEDAGLYLHHGYTFSLGENVQVDVHAAAGLVGTVSGWLIGAGAAVRL
jgi:hypothetical protein